MISSQSGVIESCPAGSNSGYCLPVRCAAVLSVCCSQGLEFVLAGEHSYPADYPELGTEITVVGIFQTYEENGYMDCHLVNAEITE